MLFTTIRRALVLYAQHNQWRKLALAGMEQDFSWQASAKIYLSLYRQLLLKHSN
jgi:starch synthase